MDKFEFHSGPDNMIAELRHYSPDAIGVRKSEPFISFHGTGPRGGWVRGPTINVEYMDQLDDLIAEAKGWPLRCKGCGRAEEDCSPDPCEKVIADREA